MTRLLFQGHGSYRITTNANTVIYVDPFIGQGYDVLADIILVTHEHQDHNNVQKVLQNANTQIIRARDVHQDGEYASLKIKDVSIEAVEAYNQNHDINACVGYVLRVDGLTIYCAGDTSLTHDMQNKLPNYHLDYALLPIDGIYNMDVQEAIKCAEIIKAKKTIPIHMRPMELFDEERARQFITPSALIVPAGTEIEL